MMLALIIVGVALLCAILVLISRVKSPRIVKPQLTWGTCWFCNSLLGDDVRIARIGVHNYAPICPRCAAGKNYKRYLIDGGGNGKD